MAVEASWDRVVARSLAGVTGVALLVGLARSIAGFPATVEARDYLLGASAALLGVRVVAHARASAVGWLFLLLSLTCAITVLSGTVPATGRMVRTGAWVNSWSWWLGYALVVVLVLVLLGAVTGHRHRLLVLLAAAGAAASTTGLAVATWPDPSAFWAVPPPGGVLQAPSLLVMTAGIVVLLAATAAGALSAVTCWLRGPAGTPRVGGWLLLGAALLLGANVLEALGYPLVWVVGAAALPVAAAVTITRYGLYDIDLLLHRSLLYGSLTVALLGLYAGSMVVLARLVPAQAAAVAAVAVALLVRPVHAALQRRVDRYVYGQRSDALQVITGLSESLRPELEPHSGLRSIVSTAASALKLPWAGLVLHPAGAFAGHGEVVVAHGRARGLPRESFPLIHQGQPVGVLVVEVRSPEENLTRGDRKLLCLLADQAGATVHAVLLTQDLQRARERLVLAREEERRRLRRDLHDGIGPCLSGVRLQVTALRRTAPAEIATKLECLTEDLQRSSAELRTLIDDLRPPALDQGLCQALEHHATRLSSESLSIRVDTEGDLTTLPAAVEVAAYRIISEAVHNTVRHARATACEVQVRADATGLHVHVRDDGTGSPTHPLDHAPHHGIDPGTGPGADIGGGVGLQSMRERAHELGGTVSITATQPTGMSVRAFLPFPIEPLGRRGLSFPASTSIGAARPSA